MIPKMSVKQIADELKKSEVTIRRWLKAGRLKGVKLGRDWIVKPEEVQRIITEGI